MLESLRRKVLFHDHEPLLADQGTSRLEQEVQRRVSRAGVKVTTIQSNEIATLLDGRLNCITQSGQCGGLLEEPFLELGPFLRSFVDDLADLGIPGSI